MLKNIFDENLAIQNWLSLRKITSDIENHKIFVFILANIQFTSLIEFNIRPTYAPNILKKI
jgi:hypothetical protein